VTGRAEPIRKLLLLVLAIAALSAVAASCGGDDGEDAASPPVTEEPIGEEPDECAKENLQTLTPGRLTTGTDNPAFPPWFEGGTPEGSQWELNDPSTGEGFESAVAYAVAGELGFSEDEVDWVVVPFNQAFRPGPKDFDFDINQVSFSEERAQAVDFSDSYYDVNQALVALQANALADAENLEDVKEFKLGAPVGTTSFAYIRDNIQPTQQPSVYDTLNDAVSALNARQVDGIVVDLPTAFFIVAVQVENGTIVGQFPAVGEQERFGMVFEKGSSLVHCVNSALAELSLSGRLEEIQQEWLSDKADAPVLE
jgi:polar amino acid transport system substrate-binding protein